MLSGKFLGHEAFLSINQISYSLVNVLIYLDCNMILWGVWVSTGAGGGRQLETKSEKLICWHLVRAVKTDFTMMMDLIPPASIAKLFLEDS